MAPRQQDARFITFSTPEYGIRALAKVLLTYQRKHGLRTNEGILSRYAPRHENNTNAYIAAVSKACGVSHSQEIDVETCLPYLVPAIIKHENGIQPYDAETLRRGIAMALES